MPEGLASETWSAYNPVRIIGGAGVAERIGEWVNATKPLLVTTPGFTRRGLTGKLLAKLVNAVVYDQVAPNPELDDLEAATQALRASGIDAIVAVGGGSVIDAAKVLSVILPLNQERPLSARFREGRSEELSTCIPLVAIPTTSGTGAEVTPFATVWDRTTHKKHSLTGPLMYPRTALLDPTLTLSLPAQETLYTALDATSHAMESLWNKNRTPLSINYATGALRLAAEALPIVLKAPGDLPARTAMQQASMLAGLAISQTRTAIAHSISYPLTSRHGVPHGLACSFTLPAILSIEAVRSALPPATLPEVQRMGEVLGALRLPSELAKYATSDEVLALVGEMYNPERADNFVMRLTPQEISSIVERAIAR